MVDHLHVVVEKADHAKDQGEEKHIDRPPVSVGHMAPAQDAHSDGDGQDKHEPAHGGGPLFGHMPGGAVFLDGLPGLQPPEHGNEQLPEQGREHKAHPCHDEDRRESFHSRCHLLNLQLFCGRKARPPLSHAAVP